MQLKKILISVLVAIMMFSLVALVATANDEVSPKPTIDLVAELASVTKVGESNVVSAGDTFEYVLKIENNPGFAALALTVNYNADTVQLVEYKLGTMFTPSAEGAEYVLAPEKLDVDTASVGKVTLSGQKLDFAETEANGTLITITFKVKEGFDGEISDILVDEENNFRFFGGFESGLLTVATNVTNASEIKVHSYEEKVTPPTCTDDGQIEYTCTVCDDKIVLVDNENPAKGHSEPADFTVVTPADCTTPGSKEKACANGCGTILATEVIPANGHSEPADFTVVTPATCTTTGSKEKKCTVCGTVTATEEIPAKGHTLPETWTQTVAPTVEAAGAEERKCSECDYKETREIPQLPAPETSYAALIVCIIVIVVVAGVVATVVVLKKKELI